MENHIYYSLTKQVRNCDEMPVNNSTNHVYVVKLMYY